MLCLYIDLTPLQNQYWQLILETLKSILLIVINIGCSGYIAMRQRFAKAFGEPEDKHVPAKEYIEKKLAELEAGEFRAETLGEILSRDEVDPDVLVPRWDAKGHLSVKKGSSSVALPTGPEQANSDVQCVRYDQAKAPWPQ